MSTASQTFKTPQHHVFIIAPNNSGSTVLRAILSRSSAVRSLSREGQHIEGFAGPSTRSTKTRLIWAAREEWLDLFSEPGAYDWAKIKRLWHKAAVPNSDHADVFVTSSPPFLLQVSALRVHFPCAKFLFMVRDPYATAEGIVRRTAQQDVRKGETIEVLAARHIVQCLRFQKQNTAVLDRDSLFFTYETLCSSPETIEARVRAMLPSLTDLDFESAISVKGIYNEPLRNMNQHQISKLSVRQIEAMNSVFERDQELLEFFGYRLLTPSS